MAAIATRCRSCGGPENPNIILGLSLLGALKFQVVSQEVRQGRIQLLVRIPQRLADYEQISVRTRA